MRTEWQWVTVTHQQHRDRGMAHDFLRYAAQRPAGEALSPRLVITIMSAWCESAAKSSMAATGPA
jgi:hypothetical protein